MNKILTASIQANKEILGILQNLKTFLRTVGLVWLI